MREKHILLIILLFAIYKGGQVITFPLLMVPFIQSADRILASVFSVVFILISFLLLLLIEKLLKKLYTKKTCFSCKGLFYKRHFDSELIFL